MAPIRSLTVLLVSCTSLIAAIPGSPGLYQRADAASTTGVVNQTTCDKKTFTYQSLAGYGLVPSDARDKFGDTLGGYGSAIAIDRSSWTKTSTGSYTGVLWGLPDRGWYGAAFMPIRTSHCLRECLQEHRRHTKLPKPRPQIRHHIDPTTKRKRI